MRKNKKGQLEIPSQDCKSDPPVPLATDEEKETVEDCRMQMAILTSRNRDLIETNKKLTKKVDGSLAIAQQILERTYHVNPDIAKIVFNDFLVNPENALYGEKYHDLLTVLKALRKVHYYHTPNQEDVYALYRAKLTDEKKLQSTLQYKEYELEKTKRALEEKSRLLEKTEIDAKNMKTEVESYRAELKRAQEKERIFLKMLFDKKETPKEEKESAENPPRLVMNAHEPVGIVIRDGKVTQRALTEEELKNIEKMNEYMKGNKTVRYVEQPKPAPVSLPIEEEKEEISLVTEEEIKTTIEKDIVEIEPILEEEILSEEEKRALNESIEIEMSEIEEEALPRNEEKITASMTKEQMKEKVDNPIFLSLLEKKEVIEIEKDPESKIDAWVYRNDEKIPLCYIDYEIKDSAIFESIVDEKNKVFFVFNNKKNFNKGNPKFITWLYKAKKIDQVQFSFSMEEQLEENGLSQLEYLP